MKAPPLRLLLPGALLLFVGCAGIPADALRLSPDSAANRAMQTRTFPTLRESNMLAAGAGVLQDLGFTLDESETKLGVITASRRLTTRRPPNGGEVMANALGILAIPVLYAPYTAYRAVAGYKEPQMVRISLVSTVTGSPPAATVSIRMTVQRIVYTNERFAEILNAQALNDPKFYEEFFTRLEKSAFLENQKNAL